MVDDKPANVVDAANRTAREHFGDSYIPHGSMEDGFVDGFIAGAEWAVGGVSEQAVEAAARAHFMTRQDEQMVPTPWDALPEWIHEVLLERMRAALEAASALGPASTSGGES